MGHKNQLSSFAQDVSQCWEGGGDSLVVGDCVSIEGDIVVDTTEHLFAFKLNIFDGKLVHLVAGSKKILSLGHLRC